MSKIQVSTQTHQIVVNARCPLCAQVAGVYLRNKTDDLLEGWCDRCGNVRISQGAVEEARRLNKAHLVSAWFRRLPFDEDVSVVKRLDIARIVHDTPDLSVLEKIDLTLTTVASMTREPGQMSEFKVGLDYPLVLASSANEAAFYIMQLTELGYVEQRTAMARLTAKGYKKLAELQQSGRTSSFAFVAMWFDPTMNTIYDEGIAPAIRKAGFKPVRVDREHHVNRIDDEIIGRIRTSRFLVADFTGQRPGVYFEAGMMLGLGRNVIWMCRREELERVHFDTRQYNFIDYVDVGEAHKRLYDRIVAIEGEGPEIK
jgi:hypothetical protein